jgi:SAM-dependent methyltransferase
MAFERELHRYLHHFEANHWFYIGRRKVLSNLLTHYSLNETKLSLDLGCSTGSNRNLLLGFSERVIGVDLGWEGLRLTTFLESAPVCQANATYLPFNNRAFDLVVALDLLEHLPDDEYALQEIQRKLKPGGHLIILVPAYEWMWSKMDEVAHHFRRYNASRLRNILNTNGYIVHDVGYMNTLLFPLLAGYRLLLRLIPFSSDNQSLPEMAIPPSPLNNFLAFLLGLEGSIITRFRLPFGGTVVGVAQRPKGY